MVDGAKPPAPGALLSQRAAWILEIWHLILIAALLAAIFSVWPSAFPHSPTRAPEALPPTPNFTENDLTDGGGPLAKHWKQPSDSLSTYLVSPAASPSSAKEIASFTPGTTPGPGLRAALLKDLNRALGDAALASKADKATADRLADPQNPSPKGEALRRLNRSILIATYPDSLKGSAGGVPRAPSGGGEPAAASGAGGSTAAAPAPEESTLLLVVVLFGALGGAISAAWTTASFIGGRDMEASWLLWHLLRTPIGGALAVVFYCILRGGLVSKSSSADLNVFFLAGTAGLVGLFTTTAMQWLRDSFNNLPHPSKGQPVPAPVIDRLIPDTLSRAAPEPSIQVVGKGFAADSIVTIDGARQEAVASPPTMIKVKVNVADPKLATNGKKSVIVINPGPGDGVRSQSHDLTITD